MVAHVGLAWRFGAAQLLSSEPYFGHDFNTHIVQTWRVLEGIEGWGQSWVYDARFLAGTPNGIFFDADNKGWEVFTLLGTWLGAQRGTAFNAFVLPQVGGRALERAGDRARGYPLGILLYPLSLLALTLIFRERLDIVGATDMRVLLLKLAIDRALVL